MSKIKRTREELVLQAGESPLSRAPEIIDAYADIALGKNKSAGVADMKALTVMFNAVCKVIA